MQFNDTINKSGIIQDCEDLIFGQFGAISDNTNKLATFTRFANRALDRVTTRIFEADGTWEWDDTNQTNYPIATTALVSGQNDYRFNVSHLKIHDIHIKGEGGDWKRLLPINPKDYGKPLDEIFGNGSPSHYDKLADAFFLYPTPDYSQASSIKVFFQREASYFTSSDTTKKPGFATTFHRLISLWASYDYASSKLMPLARILRDEIAVMEQDLEDFYSRRMKDERLQLVARRGSFR